ncbi:hypothetical protein [Actinocorallia aurantiaca]|jgi:Mce-associated membrane protein|uniref:Mce-associated membrane protein n=1 Tax=Actinocorallia aurantiaca TaxID=46204 RepID=A0ABP6GXR9_9ACTN
MRRLFKPGGLAVAASAVFLAWSGWTYQNTGPDLAAERDRALADGRERVAVLNTLDHTRAEAGRRAWLAASTGDLRARLEGESSAARLAGSRTSATGTVLAAALTAFDGRAGSAELIASVNIQLTPAEGVPTVQRKRFTADLTRTSGGWRLSSLVSLPAQGG